MAYWAGYTPTNRIVLAGGEQEEIGEDLLAGGTMTYMIPGAVVTKGSSDSDVIICDYNNTPIGFLGYEKCPILIRPTGSSALTTAYVSGDRVFVHQGKVVWSAPMALSTDSAANTSAGIVKGDALYVQDHGRVGTVDRPTTKAGYVGHALESVSSSTSLKRVKVLWGR